MLKKNLKRTIFFVPIKWKKLKPEWGWGRGGYERGRRRGEEKVEFLPGDRGRDKIIHP